MKKIIFGTVAAVLLAGTLAFAYVGNCTGCEDCPKECCEQCCKTGATCEMNK